ncbi:hypothetical protein [Halovenus salina]|uniref:Dolichyl-diphosphooligosaccharide--protein glycosyltransferase n=1 Tax=Halovenus salina TaxID=1510225 RepID=A0ABD5W337_9EURY
MTPERVKEATRSFLSEYPDLENSVEALLEQQHQTGSWTFADAPLDSGQFGELVSREFVEQTEDGEYRFVDSVVIETTLSRDTTATSTTTADATSVDLSIPTIDLGAIGTLVGSLVVIVAVRLMYFESVFRGEYVVSPANDPYFYRYWQERLLEQSTGLTDFGMLGTVGDLTRRRPLTHAFNWWFTELLGGTPDAASMVAAWLPIVASVFLAIVLYSLVVTLSMDHRIAVATLLFLALTPVHTIYTALGSLNTAHISISGSLRWYSR